MSTIASLKALCAGYKSAVTVSKIGTWSTGKCLVYISLSIVATGNIASRPMPRMIKVRADFTFSVSLVLWMHLQVSGCFYLTPGGSLSKYS